MSSFNSNENYFVITRFAVINNPCTLLIEYKNNYANQTFTKKILLKNLMDLDDPSIVISQLNKKYPSLLNKGHEQQLSKIIHNLIAHSKANHSTKSKYDATQGHDVSPDRVNLPGSTSSSTTIRFQRQSIPKSEDEILEIDLNTCSDAINLEAKRIMNLKFEKNRLKPGDLGFVYEIEKDFDPPEEMNEWDDDEEEED